MILNDLALLSERCFRFNCDTRGSWEFGHFVDVRFELLQRLLFSCCLLALQGKDQFLLLLEELRGELGVLHVLDHLDERLVAFALAGAQADS